MLSIHWIVDISYYLKKLRRRRRLKPGEDPDDYDDADVPQGVDAADYYIEMPEGPGEWWGSGASMLRLSGAVNPEDLKQLARGFSPQGKPLIQNAGAENHQQAWDLTFSVPKSLSVLWTQVDEKTRRQLSQTIRQAAEVALNYLAQVAIVTRRGKGGKRTEGALPIVAIFQDLISRELDPHLHLHCLLLNVGGREDSTVGTILSRPIYRHKLTAGAIFLAELAHLLVRDHGLKLEADRFSFRIAGVPEDLVDCYSTRTKQIQDKLRVKGLHTSKAAALACLETRKPKPKNMPSRSELLAAWQALNAEFGFTEAKALSLFGKDFSLKATPDLKKTIVQEMTQLFESESYLSEQYLIRAVARAVMAKGIPGQHIIDQVRAHLRNDSSLVHLNKSNPNSLTSRNPQYATRETLDEENEMLTTLLEKSPKSHVVRKRVLQRLLDKHLPLHAELSPDEEQRNIEQRQAVRHITAPGHAVVEGGAGTGKGYVAMVAAAVWSKSGYTVRGIAPTAMVKERLEQSTGIECCTVASLLTRLNRKKNFAFHHKRQLKRLVTGKRTYAYRGPRLRLTKRDVLLFDEAAMTGTRQFASLVKAAERAGAKLVMIGDRHQLPPIEAGGPFATIADRLGKAELKHVTRQKIDIYDPNPTWHREAGQLIAKGKVAEAMKLYADRNRLKVLSGPDETIFTLVRDWTLRGVQDPTNHIILAGTREAIQILNERCQAARWAAGFLSDQHVHIGEQQIHVGDIVLFTENATIFGVNNGDRGIVLSLNRQRRTIAVQLERTGKPVYVSYRNYKHIQLGYALTTHKAQGMTVPSVYVLLGGPMQDRHLTYVQTTRASDSTMLYVDKYNAGPKLKHLLNQMAMERPKLLASEIQRANDAEAIQRKAERQKEDLPEKKTAPNTPTDSRLSEQLRQRLVEKGRVIPQGKLLPPAKEASVIPQGKLVMPAPQEPAPAKPSPSAKAEPLPDDLLDLSHIEVEGTTDDERPLAACQKYGKLPGVNAPGGIVAEGEGRCDFKITSLAFDATRGGHLIVNESLDFNTRLQPEEVALLWDAVFDSGMAVDVFGVLSQQEPIGIEHDTPIGVNLMLADNWLGGIIYGHDAQFALAQSKVPSYSNPLVAKLRRVIEDDVTTLMCFNDLYEINPQIFLTVTNATFARRGDNRLVVASSKVTAALCVVRGGDEIVTSIPLPSPAGPLVAARFPWVYRTFQDFVAHFREYARTEPRFARTLAYAELVLLLRRAKRDNPRLSGFHHVRRLMAERQHLPRPRLNWTVRSDEYAQLLKESAELLWRYTKKDPFARLQSALLGHYYASRAGGPQAFMACKQIALDTIAQLKSRSRGANEPLVHQELYRLLPDIEERLDYLCHDSLIPTCIRAAFTLGVTHQERMAYLLDAQRLCRSLGDTSKHPATRCCQLEVDSCFVPFKKVVSGYVQVVNAHPTTMQPFWSLNRVVARQRLPFKEGMATITFPEAILVRKEQLGRYDLDKPLADLWRRVEERLTVEGTFALLDELFRNRGSLRSYLTTYSNYPTEHPAQVLRRNHVEHLQKFHPHYFCRWWLHRQNPFVDSYDLLGYKPQQELAKLCAKVRVKVEVFEKPPTATPSAWQRIRAKLQPADDPQQWWRQFLTLDGFLPDNYVSADNILLLHEMSLRGVTVPQLHQKMRQYNVANPQAALFLIDLERFDQNRPSPQPPVGT